MKICFYGTGDNPAVGLVKGQSVIPLAVGSYQEFLSGRPLRLGMTSYINNLRTDERLPLADVRLRAPETIAHRNLFAVGWNYVDHFDEGAGARKDETDYPTHPTFFTKSPETIVDPGAGVEIDSRISTQWDFEAEVAVIIGRAGKNIDADRAWTHILGMTLANDVTARDIQRRHGGQWFKGKSLDRTCPIGPFVTIIDDEEPAPVRFRLTINGRSMQVATTGQMYFDVPRIIAELSIGFELKAGDVILTGTPSGVGYPRKPPIWLADGDTLELSSEELGSLRNEIRDIGKHSREAEPGATRPGNDAGESE